jgi:MerR family transcriptional regulator, light-induced transcriptional regulator
MGKYSIKELEQLSGIKAHTIRIWEKRYKIISPQRTTTNIRFYSDDDLKKIINVSLLNNHGIKISRIASMTFEEITRKIIDMSEAKPQASLYIDQLVVAMVDMEEENFEKILATLIKKFGFQQSITDVIYPFMEKIGVLWQTGTITPAHEHFISNLIRQKLISSIAALPIPSGKVKKAILFLPEGELHEIGLLFFHYIARSKGIKTFYLGQSVPHEDLKTVYNIHQPDILITSLISSPSTKHFEKYIHTLSTDFSQSVILASGLLLRKTAFHIPKNVRPFYKATELPALLDAI